ncbi:nitrogen regulation protein NR(I) [Oxobacter pfennigii]|uniref:Nitrogen regulation protein NR(I) n=1 Tax=Oxobacter pfennigii TaxID=36849 RepID=A0A0P8W3Z7_9CLOT|nr:sigma 54-interacting transcriptional regulator [Oxobacter pfennigii]KPU42334.1 nitrogen regulation protein NR(I) [Oxobacter pfennigii]
MSNSRIAIVSADERISRNYKNQLEGLFDKEMEIILLKLEEDPEKFLGFDLILAASTAIFDEVKKKAPLNAKIINVIRNINTLELHKVFNIESGNTALVVSNYLFAAIETVELLTEVGLNHIKYIPYCPDIVIEQSVMDTVDLAITAGAVDFVPPQVKRVVDLGIKVIDISTIMEIIISLGLPFERVNLFSVRYMKEFIALNSRISDLKSKLVAVLDASSNGIMALDEEGNLTFKNNNIEKYLPCGKVINEGDNIYKYIKNRQMIDFIKRYDSRESEIFKIDNKDIMVNKNYLKSGDKINGAVLSFSHVSEIQDMEKEIRRKLNTKGNVAKYDFADIIGLSKNIKTVTDMAKKAAKTNLSVLLLGENGTGKELYAQAMHKNSLRKEGPFVAVNFAALPESLIESELFGYEEGAFTGAKKGGKPGLFELAHMGTIFLDEIGDAPLSLQARLLRVIQEKEVLRVGGISPIPVDVRIIAATNSNLKRLIHDNLFRRDLYYRINTITIRIPPLRERKEDIPSIIRYYMNMYNSDKIFTDRAINKLLEHNWPGNVRELENMINYVVKIVDGAIVDIDDLPVDIYEDYEEANKVQQERQNEADDVSINKGDVRMYSLILNELENAEKSYVRASRTYIVERLAQKDIPITDNILRRILKELEELGLISIGSTKQGTRITPKGKTSLRKMIGILNDDETD